MRVANSAKISAPRVACAIPNIIKFVPAKRALPRLKRGSFFLKGREGGRQLIQPFRVDDSDNLLAIGNFQRR
jgi:hypothetical protein